MTRHATAEQISLAVEAQAPLPAVQDQEPTSLMALAGRLACEPNFDKDKFEALLAAAERQEIRQAKAAYTQALVKMKPLLPVIDRRGKITITDKQDRSKIIQSTPYSLWEDIDEAITPILAEHGFVLSFRCGQAADGKVTVTGVLSHEAGHTEETTMTLTHDSTGSKNAVQAIGSSISYGKRYTATLLLNIRTRGEDDDGNGASVLDPIDEHQTETIFGLIKRFGVNTADFVKFMGVEAIPDIKRGDYDKAIRALNLKGKALNKDKTPTK